MSVLLLSSFVCFLHVALVDGIVYGRGSGKAVAIAKEEAAYTAYQRLLQWKEAQRQSDRPAS